MSGYRRLWGEKGLWYSGTAVPAQFSSTTRCLKQYTQHRHSCERLRDWEASMHHTLRQAIAFTTRPWRRPFYVYAYTCCYCCVQLSPLVSSSSSSSSIHDVVLLRQQQRQQQHYQTSAARTTARQPTTFNFHNRHLRCHGDHGELAALLPRREGGEASRAVSVCLRMHRSLFVSAPTAGAEATIRKTTSAAAAVHRLASNDWMGTTVTTSSGSGTRRLHRVFQYL